LLELRRCKLLGATVGHKIKARAVFTETQLQNFIGIRE
jgi:hypothetical protein